VDGDLHIDPCIPPHWEGFEAWVRSGEQCIHVIVANPDHVAGGIATVTVDGVPLDSNCIRVTPSATGTREVRVRLGARAPAFAASPRVDARPEHLASSRTS
jgi:cellobiose phosphorylase